MQNRYPYPLQAASPRMPTSPSQPGPPVFTDSLALHEEDILGHYWGIIRRHLRMIVRLFVAVELVTVLFLLLVPRRYTSYSVISIEPQVPDVLERQEDTRRDPVVDQPFFATEWKVLGSKTLAAKVIRDLHLESNPAFKLQKPSGISRVFSELVLLPASNLASAVVSSSKVAANNDTMGVNYKLIDKYLKRLTIRPELDTHMVTVAFTSTDPALATRIANAHVQAYIQHGFDLRTRSNETIERFFQSQLGQLEKRLEKSEAALNDYRRERGIVAFTLNDKDRLISERIADLNKDFVEAQERRIALQAEVETIKNDDDDAVPEVVANGLIQGEKAELSRLQGHYANLAAEYTPDYPVVANLRAQIQKVQQQERQEIDRVISSIKDRYQAAVERENELHQQLEDEKTQAMVLNNASLRDTILAREVDTNRILYRNVLERFKQLGVANEARLTNVSIIDPAVLPHFPSSPQIKLSLVLAGFLALTIGVSLAFFLDMQDKGLKTADELEHYLRLPTLATVLRFSSAEINMPASRSLARLAWWTGDSSAQKPRPVRQLGDHRQSAGSVNGVNGNNRTTPRPRSYDAAFEAYRTIRTQILLSRSETPPKTVLFTSAVSGEGKTAVAINTAVAFAGMFDQVLLIDADLRRGHCHQLLDTDASPGLTEVLSGLEAADDAIRPTHVKGLFILPSGASSPNPNELIGSRMMSEVLTHLKSKYKCVLIDSAPVLLVSDSVLLSTLVDGVVVVAGRRTPRQVVRLGCARLASIGVRIIGAVLNNVELEHQPYYTHYMRY
jgi:polysaccharide biosynthesis transport protein